MSDFLSARYETRFHQIHGPTTKFFMLTVDKTEIENGFAILYNICDKRGRSLRLNYRLSLCGHLIFLKVS